jgi:hypothetical protein
MSETAELFILAGIWTFVVVLTARTIKNWPARVVVFAFLLGIPFWEMPFGFYNFVRLCRDDARLRVVEKFPPQERVCAAYPDTSLHRELLAAGFPFVETKGAAGEVRSFFLKDGTAHEVAQSAITSTYCLTFVNNIRMPMRVLRHEVQIVRVSGGDVVARQSRFSWLGMWWQEATSPILGNGGTCAPDPRSPILALRNGVI